MELISGHPLLTPAAVPNLKELDKLPATGIDVLYHFVLVEPDSRITRTKVKKGDAFDRLILRVLRIKTEKIGEQSECVETAPRTRIDQKKNSVEVWIYGSGWCLQTETSYIASR